MFWSNEQDVVLCQEVVNSTLPRNKGSHEITLHMHGSLRCHLFSKADMFVNHLLFSRIIFVNFHIMSKPTRRTSSQIPLEPEIVIQEGDNTAETNATRSNSPEPSPSTCSNEQLANLQKAIENGFTSMANSMSSMVQKVLSSGKKI